MAKNLPVLASSSPSFLIVCIALAGWSCGPNTPGVEGADLGGDGEGENDAAPTCGDGVQTSDELCDDGNRTAGDGCSPECVPSGTHLECNPILEGHWENQAYALLAMPDRTFVAAGKLLVEDGLARGWIGRYEETGNQLWFVQITPTNEDYGSVVDLAPDGQNGVWALIQNGAMGELVHFDASGVADQPIDITSAVEMPLVAYAIEFVAESLWVGGRIQGDLWLGRYEPVSEQFSTLLLEDHLGFDDEIRALGQTETEVVFAGTVSTSPNSQSDVLVTASTDILFVRFDLQGNEVGRTLWGADPGSEFARVADVVVSDGGGQWFIGGSLRPFDPTQREQSWMGRILPEPAWSWSSAGVVESDGGVGFGDVSPFEGAVVLAAGAYTTLGEGWIAQFGGEGAVGWRQANSSPEFQNYEEQRFAVDSEGRLRSLGKAWTRDGSSLLKECVLAW